MKKSFVVQNKEKFKNFLYKLGYPPNISETIQVDTSTVCNWCSGYRVPNSKNLEKLLDKYDKKYNSLEEIGVCEKKEDYDTFGKRLKKFLDQNNILYTNFADTLGVKKSTVSNWIKDKFPPECKYLIKMSEYYEISVDYLLFGDVNKEDFTTKTGLNIQSLNKLEKLNENSNPTHLINIGKRIDDISEIDVINFLLNNTDFFEFFRKQIIEEYANPYKEEMQFKGKTKKDGINVELVKQDIKKSKEKIRNNLSEKLEEAFNSFFEFKLNELEKSKKF